MLTDVWKTNAKPAVASIMTPHVLFTLCPSLFMVNNIKVAIIMNGVVYKISDKETAKLDVNPTVPKTRVNVSILSPITLPMVISSSPARVAATETATSGTTHPRASTVSPTKNWSSPKIVDIVMALFTIMNVAITRAVAPKSMSVLMLFLLG